MGAELAREEARESTKSPVGKPKYSLCNEAWWRGVDGRVAPGVLQLLVEQRRHRLARLASLLILELADKAMPQ